MIYNDDILDVYAYLQARAKNNLATLGELTGKSAQLEGRVVRLDLDGKLRALEAIAQSMGISVEASPSPAADPCRGRSGENPSRQQLLTALPGGFDYAAAFSQLAKEAHANGYVDVHPGDVLSLEEMRRAAAFEAQIDADFEALTGLTEGDTVVLGVAVALQILRFALLRYIKKKKDENKDGVFGLGAEQVGEYPFDLPGDVMEAPAIKPCEAILNDSPPFLLGTADMEQLAPSVLLGTHNPLGWLFGALNMLTDTVTVLSAPMRLRSYHACRDGGVPSVGDSASTLRHILLPVAKANPKEQENTKSFLAAAIRESDILGAGGMTVQDNAKRFADTLEILKNIDDIQSFGLDIDQLRSFLSEQDSHPFTDRAKRFFKQIDLEDMISQAGMAALVNILITVAHGCQYNQEKDASIKLFTVRTKKILAYSNLIAAACNSIPAIDSLHNGDIDAVGKLDLGGLLTGVLQTVGTAQFWIKAKAEFIVERHMEAMRPEMDRMNLYFPSEGDQ